MSWNEREPKAFSWNELLRGVATCHYDSKVHDKLKFSPKFAQLLALLVSLTGTISAQQKSDANQAPFNAAAYQVGERLTYNIDFANFVSAAHVELFVAARGAFFNRDAIQVRAHAETAGVVNVALLALNNDYTTYVDVQSGLPFRTQQVVREARRSSEASSDYNQPAGAGAIAAKLRSGEFPGTYDLLSALYRLRALPLSDGASYFMTVLDDGTTYQVEVKVTGRQLIKTGVGSFNTIVTRINVKSGRDYDLRVYLSDDERHVPVLFTAKHPAGEIRGELAGSEIVGAASTTVVVPPAITPPISSVRKHPKSVVDVSAPGGPVQSSGSPTREVALDLPFKIGEQLNYRVFLAGGAQSVGAITVAARTRGRYFNRDGLLLSATAQTTAAGARLFPVTDQIRSYVDPLTLLPFRTELALSEGKYRRNRNYDLDQNRGAATVERGERIDIPVGTHDLISLFYAIRTFDLSPPKRNAISIMATDRPLTLFVTSLRRETIELDGQKISTILLSLTTDDAQSDKMQIRIWVGDDSRRLPLRIAAVTELGPVRADLAINPMGAQ
jgi:hypothetical protein